MKKEECTMKLKEEIENKRRILNRIIMEETSKEEILKFSQDLDILISEYTRYVNKGIKNSG